MIRPNRPREKRTRMADLGPCRVMMGGREVGRGSLQIEVQESPPPASIPDQITGHGVLKPSRAMRRKMKGL